MRIARKLRRSIERLGPYPSLLIVAVPLAIAEPLKVAAMFVLEMVTGWSASSS